MPFFIAYNISGVLFNSLSDTDIDFILRDCPRKIDFKRNYQYYRTVLRQTNNNDVTTLVASHENNHFPAPSYTNNQILTPTHQVTNQKYAHLENNTKSPSLNKTYSSATGEMVDLLDISNNLPSHLSQRHHQLDSSKGLLNEFNLDPLENNFSNDVVSPEPPFISSEISEPPTNAINQKSPCHQAPSNNTKRTYKRHALILNPKPVEETIEKFYSQSIIIKYSITINLYF